MAADKIDNVISKISANELSEADLKRVVVETKDALSTNQKGILGEAISDVTHKTKYPDFTALDCKLPRNNGFDGVYVKYVDDGSIEAVHIVEAKYGTSQLSTIQGVNGTGDIKQMSAPWVRDVIDRMQSSGDLELIKAANTLEDIMDESPELITKYLDRITKETGDVGTTLLD